MFLILQMFKQIGNIFFVLLKSICVTLTGQVANASPAHRPLLPLWSARSARVFWDFDAEYFTLLNLFVDKTYIIYIVALFTPIWYLLNRLKHAQMQRVEMNLISLYYL